MPTTIEHAAGAKVGETIPKNDFVRGTMGNDRAQSTNATAFRGQIVDRATREAIIQKSKNAHFEFTACRKIDTAN